MNKIKSFVAVSIACAFSAGCVSTAPSVTSAPHTASRAPASFDGGNSHRRDRRPNTLLVKLRADATPEQVAALKALYQELDLKHEKHLLNKKIARIKIRGPQAQDREEEIAAQLKATGAVVFAEPDYTVPMSIIPNDPSYSNQWFHGKIGSETAWNYSKGSSTVQVAMCDSGFDLSHPDLASQFVLPGYNTVKDNSQIDSINGHGTMTSGTVAAIGNNGVGITGMAWNIRLMPIQITDRADGASTYSDIVECIRYASDHGAKVANISYDYTYASAAVSDAAAYMRAAGGLVVTAAGNGGADISSWGTSPNLFIVGATDSSDQLASFSNFGTPVDLVAPGLDIYTTQVGGNYGYVSGTSLSTPIVTGTAALIYSLNPTFTPAQVEQYLLSTTTDLGVQGKDLTFAGGRLAAGSAVQAAAGTVTPITLDNLAAGASDANRTFGGKWCSSPLAGSYMNPSLVSCGNKTDTYRFTPNITKSQAYKISIRYLSQSTYGSKIAVKIRTASGNQTKQINMQTGGGAWTSLGVYNLNVGTNGYVEVSDASGTANVDGVMFEPQ